MSAMLPHTVAAVAVVLIVLASHTTAFKINSLRNRPVQKREAPNLDLDTLNNALEGIDTDLADIQKRTCAIGINSHHCALANVDDRMLSREWLNNGYSPGKRSGELSPEQLALAERELEELEVKRQAISTLKRLLMKLKDRQGPSEPIRKRSCSLRLGGLCLTEALDRAASQYYYLRSADSPGKRRKREATAEQQHNP